MDSLDSPLRQTLRCGEVRVVRWTGRVSTDSALVERADLLGWLDAGERNFVFNLTGVTRMSSFVIGVLVGCLKRIRNRGAILHLVVTQSQVQMFSVLSLDVVFPLYLDEAEAIGDLHPGASRPRP